MWSRDCGDQTRQHSAPTWQSALHVDKTHHGFLRFTPKNPSSKTRGKSVSRRAPRSTGDKVQQVLHSAGMLSFTKEKFHSVACFWNVQHFFSFSYALPWKSALKPKLCGHSQLKHLWPNRAKERARPPEEAWKAPDARGLGAGWPQMHE